MEINASMLWDSIKKLSRYYRTGMANGLQRTQYLHIQFELCLMSRMKSASRGDADKSRNGRDSADARASLRA